MASLILSSIGGAIGAAFGGPVGAVLGRTLGGLGGGLIDKALFGTTTHRASEGPRLDDLDVMGSTEGAAIPRLYGRARLAGELIWATNLQEVVSTRTETSGGKGGGGRQRRDHRDHLPLLRQFRAGALRGAGRRHRPGVGRRQGAGHAGADRPPPSRRRDARSPIR